MDIEKALGALEEQLAIAAKEAKAANAALKKTQSSAKLGHLRDLRKALNEGRAASQRYAAAMDSAAASWKFDIESHVANGDYLDELLREANGAGLKLVARDGRISCFPMLLTLVGKDGAVNINRKPELRIRPRELVQLLIARQKRPQRFQEQKVLETLFNAYRHLAGPQWSLEARGVGPVVPLIEIYELLTLLPGAEREYPKEEFTRDILLLDRKPDLCTRDGRRFALPASTGTKTLKQRLTVIDEHGNEQTYVSIRFDKD